MAEAYLADRDAPVKKLAIAEHFSKLSEKEKLYAHHLSRASHWGTRAVLRSVSYESEDIYDLILTVHAELGGKWDTLAEKAGVTKEEATEFLEYSAQFLSNLGNFKSFGDSKFVPRLSSEAFGKISGVSEKSAALFDKIKEPLYATSPEEANLLGFPESGHVTGYYSNNVTKAEVEAVQEVLGANNIMVENTRIFKNANGLVLKIASANTESSGEFKNEFDVNGTKLVLEYGDHADDFKKIVAELEEAKKHAANDTQVQMVDKYIESFKTGSMKAHVDSQRLWIKDIGPSVESNIGFIETYRDPAGVRGEWEGLVAMVNREQTEKFGVMVSSAEKYITQLPWPAAFEKPKFNPPDFTSLEVLTFAGSGIPSGINIPNYDVVRINDGFKNVSLGNVINVPSDARPTFIEDKDVEGFKKNQIPAFDVQVGIHELLGHGSGKLLTENEDGTFNFDKENPPISPLTNELVKTYYKKGETWSSKFGATAGAYEECRAETVAMYLSTDRSLLKIFGHEGEEANTVVYFVYLMMARAGLLALEFYDPKAQKWGQPHMQARYAILQVFIEAGLARLESTKEDYSDLVIKLDQSKIETVGREAVGKFLQKLHIYKSTADVENGVKFFTDATTVKPDFGKLRDAVLKAKRPRRQLIQANTSIVDGKAVLTEYEETAVGMIQSFAERAV